MLYSVCGMSPSGSKFFLPIGVKPYGETKTAQDIFEMAKSVFFLFSLEILRRLSRSIKKVISIVILTFLLACLTEKIFTN